MPAAPIAASSILQVASLNATPDLSVSGGVVTFSKAGTYRIQYNVSVTTVGAIGDAVSFALRHNSVPVPNTTTTVDSSALNLAGSYSNQAIITVAAGDTVDLYATITGSVTLENVSLTAVKVS